MKKLILTLAFLLIPTMVSTWPGTVCKRLSWIANTESDLAGYRIYWAATQGGYNPTDMIDPGNVTEYILDPTFPQDVYIVITAYDTTGNESDFSAHVFYSAIDQEVPAIPGAPTLEDNQCVADLDMDGDVDGSDVYVMKSEFGRSPINNPCYPNS